MKRIRIYRLLPISLLILCGAILPGVNALAQSAGIAVGSASGLPGATVTIPVSFTAGATAVSTVQFDLMFSSSIAYGSTATGAAAAAASKSASANPIAGGLRVMVFGLNTNAIGSGVLAEVQFTISGSAPAGIVPISITGIVASDPNALTVSTIGSDGTVQVLAPPDTTPPVISGVASSSISSSGATISWTTNEFSDTQIEYGTTTGYGSSTTPDSSLGTSHSQALTGLTASTTYNYRVKSRDAAGNLATSGNYTFATAAPPDTTPPVISGVASSSISSSGATISWTTNEAADTQIEYGTTTAYGSSTMLDSSLGTSHSQALTGLTASTTYNYRVKSRDAAGNLATSGNYTFATAAPPDTTPPVISGVASSSITSSSVTISWTTNEAADTQIEYGTTTAYGSSTTLDTSMATSHSQALTGLTASTTYNYRVKSKDAAGNLATSGNYTFATAAPPDTTPPVISGVASSSITSSSVTISWTTNEAADTQIEYGTTTAYGSSTTLDTSMATSHSQALSGLTASTTYNYRVKSKDAAGNLATSGNYTFATAAPPDTTPPVISGVASSSITSSGATISWTTNEAADTQIEYGTTTAYGSSTMLDSSLGTSHSQALTGLTASTIYNYRVKSKDAAGNLATSGNYTFATAAPPDTTPPVISGVASSSISSSGATISWTTNEAADTQIEYGTTTGYGSSTTLDSSLGTSHSQALSGLTASTTYNYRVKSRDAAGNLATSGNYTFATAAPPDTTPPVISGVASSSISSSGATISWTTNEAADTQIEYGTTTAYGSSTMLDSSLGTSHSQALTGLTASTTYNYRVKSKDAAGNLATSGNYTFATAAPPDTTPPVISGVASSSITSSGATISWTTNEAADTQVEYGTTTAYGSSTTLDTSMATTHSQALSGLTASTTYNYRVKSKDAAGNLATSGNYTFATAAPPDTTPPVISGVASSSITSSGATISWTTNEAADTQIEYGTTTAYGSSTMLDTSMATTHSQALSGLTASTTYNYRVKSKDAAGNLAVSGNYTFTTSAVADTTPPVISSVASSSISSSGATISWTTNEAADTQIEYGTTTAYGSSTTLDTSMATSHSQALSGLAASTTYNYRVKSKDAAGNLATSGNYTFATAAPPDTTPPVISGVASSSITSSSVTISWTTNEAADTQIEYGTTTAYGSSTTLDTSMATTHSQALSGLTASTTYNYRVKSKDAAGNLAVSGNYTFTTSAVADTTPPVISSVASSSISSSGATISWTTNEAADTQIEYGTTTAYGSSTTLDSSLGTSHSQALTGLTASTTYNYRVKSKDAAGNLATSGNYTFATAAPPDTTPPVISSVTSSSVTSSGATISWTTNEAADTQVEYGTTTAYGSSTMLDSSLGTSHSQALTGLTASTTYSYRVKSRDAEGNLAVSPAFTFNTVGNAASQFALPHFSTNAGRENPNEDIMVGMALANIGASPATLTLTAIDRSGSSITGPGITNPATRTLNPGTQMSMLDLNIFGEGLAASNSTGWIKVESTSSDVGGFFLTFDDKISLMDGASFGYAIKDAILTEIEPAGSTKIEIANTSSSAASLTFSLMKADGTIRGQQTRTINANGAFSADLFADLFTQSVPDPTDYVRMQSTENVQPFQLMRKRVGDISSLPGQDAAAGATNLHAPQYAMGGPWRSSLSIVNLDSRPGLISLQLLGKDGMRVGITRTMEMPAKGKIRIDDPEFFTPVSAGIITSGYVKISSDGIRLVGSMVFDDGSGQSFSSALPLIYNLKTSVLFSHVASNDTYFTGIAIVNPGLPTANVNIEVFDADGRLIGQTIEIVPSAQRKARLLTEYIPLLTGRNLTSGYIRLTSDWPIASFSLFGTNDLSVLSAIPAQ